MSRSHCPKPPLEICLLAGGLSSRMKTDKARLRLGGRTLLEHIWHTAQKLNAPVRILDTDIVPRCGPLGGVYSGLVRSWADAVLFLPCDMPFVSRDLLLKVVRALPKRGLAAFVLQTDCLSPGAGRASKLVFSDPQQTRQAGRCETLSRSMAKGAPTVGFPFVLKRESLPVVERLLTEQRCNLQTLATALEAKLIKVPKPFQFELFNINTPADWKLAREFWKANQGKTDRD